jgi:hypothetical protein
VLGLGLGSGPGASGECAKEGRVRNSSGPIAESCGDVGGRLTIGAGEWIWSAKCGRGKFTNYQIKADKRDCQRRGLLKIDILSNRALTHLWGISHRCGEVGAVVVL